MKSYQKDINEQERKDRDICIRMVKQLLVENYEVIEVKDLPVYCPIDLEFTIRDKETNKTYTAFFEVKSRNKNERQLAEYPWAELKVERLQNMRTYQQQIHNSCLFYAVILNDKDFIMYDLLSIDYSKINFVDWEVKQRQFDPNSVKKTYKIAQLPFNIARHANIIQTPEKETEQKLF